MFGNDMQYLLPEDLIHPRVYFTEFDRVTFSQVAWNYGDIQLIKKNIERKIKLLGLIKGMIVVATSHLFESELAQEIIFENPNLIKEGVIVPALISKYKSFSEFLDNKRNNSNESNIYEGKEKDDMNIFLMDNAKKVIAWNVGNTNKWFKSRLINDLKNESSVIRYNLKTVNIKKINRITKKIEECENPSRGDIYHIGKSTRDKTIWEILSNYADFIYYLSGALAVNSEGILPQENLIDFSITDLINKKNRLSEYEIFYRIFVNIVEEKMQKIFPIQILDILSFKEIIELRNGLYHDAFIKKYNSLLGKIKDKVSISDSESLILTIKEVYEFEDYLKGEFYNKIGKELKQMKIIIQIRNGIEVIKSVGSLIPIFGTIDSLRQIFVSSLTFLGLSDPFIQLKSKIDNYISKVKKMVMISKLENKPIFIKYLSEISKIYRNKIF